MLCVFVSHLNCFTGQLKYNMHMCGGCELAIEDIHELNEAASSRWQLHRTNTKTGMTHFIFYAGELDN